MYEMIDKCRSVFYDFFKMEKICKTVAYAYVVLFYENITKFSSKKHAEKSAEFLSINKSIFVVKFYFLRFRYNWQAFFVNIVHFNPWFV